MVNKKSVVQEFKLDPNWELRFEVESKNEKVTLELKNGLAEIFGAELVKGKKYQFTAGVAVYTWQGCTIELVGKTYVSYIARKTPMCLYLNCHAALEQMRETAEKDDTRGPITMIVGSRDVGKYSILCRILLNYAVRIDRRPIFVNLDVDQGHLAIPGTVGALLVERPYNIMEGFNQQASLVFHFGYKKPQDDVALYISLITRLAEVYSDRLQDNKKAKASGVVINTCSWVKTDDYKLLVYAAQVFEVDVILVLDQERLYNKLVRDMPNFVKIVFLPKSKGVDDRSQTQRTNARNQGVREYFYGSRIPLCPHSFEVKWNEAKLYKIEASILSASHVLSNTKPKNNLMKLVAVTPGPNLLHHLLSVSFADSPEDDVVQTNIAGFICVTNVDVDRQTFTILSPQPGPLPNTVLLLSDIQFMDSH